MQTTMANRRDRTFPILEASEIERVRRFGEVRSFAEREMLARIENYLGFPTGIPGRAPMARAYNQAAEFGVESAIPDEAVGLEIEDGDGPGLSPCCGRLARGRPTTLSPPEPLADVL